MKKVFTLALLLATLGVSTPGFAQTKWDVLVKADGTQVKARVSVVSVSHVYFSYPNETAVYSLPKSELLALRHASGRVERFAEAPARQPVSVARYVAPAARYAPTLAVDEPQPTGYRADPKSLARVNRVDGVEVYVLNEPVREFETMVDATSFGANLESLYTAGLFNESINEKLSLMIRKIKAKGVRFDAIVYSGGRRITAIRFTDAPNPAIRGIARIRKIDAVDAYVMCEPLVDFEALGSKGGGIKVKSLLTKGFANNTIEEEISRFVRRIRKDGYALDGLLYTGGKTATAIRYNR